jgi:hypothetical protein
MFQVFPVLFPLCSQFHRQSFHRVPCVLGFRRSGHERSFLYSFACTAGTLGTMGTG